MRKHCGFITSANYFENKFKSIQNNLIEFTELISFFYIKIYNYIRSEMHGMKDINYKSLTNKYIIVDSQYGKYILLAKCYLTAQKKQK